MIEDFRRITATTAIVMVVLSSIGLLVGGIGVMNIMLVSVTERTKEIGVRKAVGARRRDIVVQFLTEAVVLTFLGGLIGMLFGWTVSTAARVLFPSLPTSVPLWAAALGVIVSVGVGLFFGIWPASKAARLDPVEALRYEQRSARRGYGEALLPAQFHDRRARAAFFSSRFVKFLDVRVPAQQFRDRLLQHTHPVPMHDSYPQRRRQHRVIQKLIHRVPRFLGSPPDHVDLLRDRFLPRRVQRHVPRQPPGRRRVLEHFHHIVFAHLQLQKSRFDFDRPVRQDALYPSRLPHIFQPDPHPFP
jgi:hypothetical protein